MTLTVRQTWVILALVIIGFAFTLFQASWIADRPTGGPKLVADHGPDPLRRSDGCIVDSLGGYRTVYVGPDVGSLQAATGSAASAVQIQTEMQGNQLLVARTFKSDCASDMARPRSTISEALAGLTKPERIWRVKGAAQVQALLAALPADSDKDMILGDDEAVKAAHAARPKMHAFSVASAQACTSAYRLSGMWGGVPDECKNGAMLITLDDLGYTLWGWPNRLLARTKEAGVPVIVAASVADGAIKGLDDVEQYGEIANTFNGYIWIDKIEDLGPALRR